MLAGGLDSFDWLKDRIKRPKVVVDLSQINELAASDEVNGGLEIGAMTTLTEVVRNPIVKEKFSILSTGAEAGGLAADPQPGHHRRQRVAGRALLVLPRRLEVLSRRRQHLLRRYARPPINREHAILGADRCVAVNPSDTAPALIALDAKMVIRSTKGERVVDAEDYFIGPGIDITRMTVLKPGELLTAIRIPATWAGAQFYFEKVRDRQVWDFPLVNVASRHGVQRRQHRAHPHRGERRRGPSAASEGSRRRGAAASRATRTPARWPGNMAIAGRRAAALQRLQGSADAESGEARDSRRGGANMGIIEWATSPWGQDVPIHIAFYLIWVAAIAGLVFLIVPRHLVALFREAGRVRRQRHRRAAALPRAIPERVPRHSLAARLFHWVMAAAMFALLFTAFLPEVGVQFAWVTYHWIAGLVLTALDHLPHHPCDLLHGFLVHLAGQGRHSRMPSAGCARSLGKTRRRRRGSPSIRSKTRCITAIIVLAGLAVTLTGVFMMFRVRTAILPRNPYLFGDMTWGMMYVLHGLAGVGLIALIMVHVYFALRPEKLVITKSMIFGSMSREHYLEHHDPERWAPGSWSTSGVNLEARCNAVEECYEFMLAYAAQGLDTDAGSQSGTQIREFLRNAQTALTGIAEAITATGLQPAAFISVVERDARDSLAAIDLVLAQPAISSQLIDNLNASIHLRALLTDLFLLDEILKLQRVGCS